MAKADEGISRWYALPFIGSVVVLIVVGVVYLYPVRRDQVGHRFVRLCAVSAPQRVRWTDDSKHVSTSSWMFVFALVLLIIALWCCLLVRLSLGRRFAPGRVEKVPGFVPATIVCVVLVVMASAWFYAGFIHRVHVVLRDQEPSSASAIPFYMATRRSDATDRTLSEQLAAKEGTRCIVWFAVLLFCALAVHVFRARIRLSAIFLMTIILVVCSGFLLFETIPLRKRGSIELTHVPSVAVVAEGTPSDAMRIPTHPVPRAVAEEPTLRRAAISIVCTARVDLFGLQFHAPHAVADPSNAPSVHVKLNNQSVDAAYANGTLSFRTPIVILPDSRAFIQIQWINLHWVRTDTAFPMHAQYDRSIVSISNEIDGEACPIIAVFVHNSAPDTEWHVSSSFGRLHFWMHTTMVSAALVAITILAAFVWRQPAKPCDTRIDQARGRDSSETRNQTTAAAKSVQTA